MTKNILILGLGKFGGQLAVALAERGVRVHGIDHPERLKTYENSLFAQAAYDLSELDNAQDLQDLFSKFDASFEAAVISLGDQEALATTAAMALFDMDIPRLIVKAVDTMHESVLQRMCSSDPSRLSVLIPERYAAQGFAHSLSSDFVERDIPLDDSVSIREVHCPASLIGKTLAESELRENYQINVVAIRFGEASAQKRPFVTPSPDAVLTEDCTLAIAGLVEHLDALCEELG